MHQLLGSFAPLQTSRAMTLFLLLLGSYLAAVWLPGHSFFAPPGASLSVEFACAAAPNLLLQGLAGLLHLHLRARHRQALAEGYLQLYGAGRAFPAGPFIALSAGNAVLLAVALFKGFWLPDDQLMLCLRGIITAEAAAVASVTFAYLRLTSRHNRRKPPPDAYEILGAVSSVHTPLLFGERRGGGSEPGEAARSTIAEEQAELIRFLQGRVERLHGEVLRLQSERLSIAGRGVGRGEEALEGAKRRLRAQEQEVRALHACREALAGELRAAQRLLDERDGKLETFQGTHEQHLEENQRLRSIIQEWSLRNAKLEHRLAIALQGGAGGSGAGR